jgi:hypothetical protein
MKIASPLRDKGVESPKKQGIFDASMVATTVNDQLFKYEAKM